MSLSLSGFQLGMEHVQPKGDFNGIHPIPPTPKTNLFRVSCEPFPVQGIEGIGLGIKPFSGFSNHKQLLKKKAPARFPSSGWAKPSPGTGH